jgi:cell division septation protein DedD
MESVENSLEDESVDPVSYRRLINFGIAAGLIFGMGFLFGKFTSPKAQNVAVSEADDLDERQAQYEKMQDKLKLSYYKDLSKEPRKAAFDTQPAKEDAAAKAPIEAPKPIEADIASLPPPKMPDEKPSSDRIAKALEKALGKETPDSVTSSAKAQLPNRTSSPFAVQVASLPDRKVAEELANKLNLKGYDTRLVQADIPGRGTVYRVRIHGYASRAEADEARDGIVKAERLDAITVAQ